MGGYLRIQTLADRIKGPIDTLRLKLQLQTPASAQDGAASPADIAALVDHQLRHWRRRGIDRKALLEGCGTLNEKSISVFVFEIRAGTVTVWDKPGFSFPPELEMLRAMQARSFANRAALYRVLLQAVVARSEIDADMTLAIDVNDIPVRMRGGPLFAFQTADATRNILLPDVDFFHWNWYAGQHDDRAYEDKTITACFAGASTGGPISEATIAGRALPRLRAAAHFVGQPGRRFQNCQGGVMRNRSGEGAATAAAVLQGSDELARAIAPPLSDLDGRQRRDLLARRHCAEKQ